MSIPAGAPEPARRRRDLRISLLVGLLCLVVYNANLRVVGTGDSLPARYQPFAMWRYGTLLLDPILQATTEGHPQPYWIVQGRDDHSISLYPVVLPVLIAPLYLPAVAYLNHRGWTASRLLHTAAAMEKGVSSLLAAAASALFYLLLRRRAEPADALLLTAAFAFGTDTWMIGSQALWQHGLAELLLVGALLLLTGPCTAGRALAVGVLCGLIAGNRPPDALLAAALGLYALRWAGYRRAAWLAAGAAVPICLVVIYNLAVTGKLIGAYGIPRQKQSDFFRNELLAGVAGMLVSPTRGLLVFSPFLLLVPAGFRRALRDPRTRWLTIAVAIAMAVQILFYAKADWRGGRSWGQRWLTDLVPLLVWMLPPALAALRGAGRAAFAAAIAVSIAIQAVGAFWYGGASDAAIFAVRPGAPGEMRATWDPHNIPFLVEPRHKPAAFTLPFHGGDRPAVRPAAPPARNGVTLPPADHGATLVPAPVARRDPASPAGPGAPVAAPQQQPPPDAGAAGGTLRRSDAGGLAAAARQAARRIAGDQRPAGFWLTWHTPAPRFTQPHAEMNTYLTAMMLDLLAPVAAAAGLDDNLARARAHLSGQIEESGLVRYHGRPDGPTIHTLGCVITPDADDTALTWRLAGTGDRQLLARALAVLAQYRTRDGLYRTWLAPRERYQCLDPGTDPDPADVGIQMHVLLLLAQADPPAAAALCDALRRTIAEPRLWVYYQAAPLVPLLRQADLPLAGCPLRIPEQRLNMAEAGQQIWLDAGRLLTALRGTNSPAAAASSQTLALLRNLAQDDFASVRLNPPLLYHNDFTAHTPRFYWSEDFGYALWLRLYLEHERRQGGDAGLR